MSTTTTGRSVKWLIKLRAALTQHWLLGFGLPLLIILLLRKSLVDFLNLIMVDPLLSKIETSLLNDILFGLLAGYTILLCISRIKQFVPSVNAWYLQLFLAAGYLYFRFHQNDFWYFHGFANVSTLYYADLILVIMACNSVNLLSFWLRSKAIKRSTSFFDDTSLGKTKPDKLGYRTYVDHIVKRIDASYPDTAMAIGVNGKWGSGKTSFFDLMKRSMPEDQVISVDFAPWNSLSPSAIIQDFFDTIQSALRPYHSQLPGMLNTYTDKLINLHDEGWGKAVKELKGIFVPEASLTALYEQINEAIKAIDKKLIIYIDDLDRLDNDEITEVIRLIRNTANFSNTFFIVAYDRNYVIAALKAKNAFNHAGFLEKIFQIEIKLPYFDEKITREIFAEQLKTFYDSAYHKEIDKEIIGTPGSSPNYFKGWIETLRDVSRLSNGVTLNLNELLREVVFSEFIRLEILRLKFPSVHEALYQKSDVFLADVDTNTSIGYTLRSLGDDRGANYDLTQESSEFELYLHTNRLKLGVEPEEIKKIAEYVDDIFGQSKLTARFRNDLSVVYPSRFKLYFAYTLLDGTLSEVEFIKARTGGEEEMIKQIDKWSEKGLNYSVYRRFLQVKTFDDRQDFETVVTGIFYFARQPDKGKQYNFDNGPLAEILSDHNQRISLKFYGGDKKEYADFVRGIFDKAKAPFTFDMDFLEHLNREHSDAFPIPKKERTQICLKFFERFTQSMNKWNGNVWDLFNSCVYKKWTPTDADTVTSEKIYPEGSKQIMISAIRQHLKGFMEDIIDVRGRSNTHFLINSSVITIFGSYEEFYNFIDDIDPSFNPHLYEFKNFLSLLKEDDFKKAKPFTFEELKPKRSGRNE